MKKYRVIIAGSRNCPENDPDLVVKIHELLINMQGVDIEIVSGACRGADMLGEFFAAQFGLSVKRFPADWDKHGKAAGPIRNTEMAGYSTHLIALHNGKSKGTQDMINKARKFNLMVAVIDI